MKHKLIYNVLTVLIAVLFTSAGDAHAAKRTKFQSYVQKSSYETRLKNAASNYALAKADECDMRNTVFQRKRYDILEQPEFFGKAKNPTKGIWIEKVSVFVCGEAHFLDVTVISNKRGRLPKMDVSESKSFEGAKPQEQENFYGEYDF